MTDDDFEKIKTEKDRSIQILHFTDLDNIRPIYYDKTYHAVPETGGEKAFQLLREAMRQEGKVAVAKTVMGQKETMLSIIPTDDGVLIETMFFYDEIKDIPKDYTRPEVNEAELNMAKQLISSMNQTFEPELYKDEYQERVKELIATKIAGKEVVASQPQEESNVIDLMEALKKSVDQAGKPKRRAPRKKAQ